jgi:lipoprotein NlpD
VVARDDTLYSVAWRFGLDYRALASNNGIDEPYTIRPGQRLRLDGASTDVARTAPPTTPGKPAPAVARKPAVTPGPASSAGWRFPTDAPVGRKFGDGNRGIDFRLEPERSVQAAAAGEVVYAGNVLGGYRHLVIVKHDPRYLSAYSLDRPIVVQEGQRVAAGGLLAERVDPDRRTGTLHFEIRFDGKPVDPGALIGR